MRKHRTLFVVSVIAFLSCVLLALCVTYELLSDDRPKYSPNGKYVATLIDGQEPIISWARIRVETSGWRLHRDGAEVSVSAGGLLDAVWHGNTCLVVEYDNDARFVLQPRYWNGVRIIYTKNSAVP